LVAQFVVGVIVGFVVGVASVRGAEVPDWIMPSAALASMVLGGLALYLSVRFLLRGPVWERGGRGFGLVRTALPHTAVAALGGAGLATLYAMVAMFVIPPESGSRGPLAEMASSSDFGFAVVLFMALALAPFIEEFLFRGVMFHGLRQGVGPWWAAVIVTVLFVVLHVFEAAHYWPALLFVTCLGVFAVVVRIRFASLAPAVVAHFSYNAVMAVAAST
jgi:membrane protease YdiL (CAAX protease family)